MLATELRPLFSTLAIQWESPRELVKGTGQSPKKGKSIQWLKGSMGNRDRVTDSMLTAVGEGKGLDWGWKD